MKSKSFELPKISGEKALQNKTYDFIKYYNPDPETDGKLSEKRKNDGGGSNENTSKNKSHVSKRERSPNKKNKKLKEDTINISTITMDDSTLQPSSGGQSDSKVTSTPNIKKKKNKNETVKSIMKNPPLTDNSMDISAVSVSKNKPKKRNKSVSFMLEDTEEVAIKRSKSELSISHNKIPQNDNTKLNSVKQKKPKKKSQNGKENKADINNLKLDNDASDNVKKDSTKDKTTENNQTNEAMDVPVSEQDNKTKHKKKNRKQKKSKQVEDPFNAESENAKEVVEEKDKKLKKKKRNSKQAKDIMETEGEPAAKSSKKEIKPDIIAQDLENLSIGDNAHTLTNLLDEMTVMDKKKKKNKHKPKKNKQQNNTDNAQASTDEAAPAEEKEKVKWMKRKWNKDKKGAVNDSKLTTSIVVENLPLKIMCNYKKLLTEHFAQFGTIKAVGIAEVYSIEHPEVFTTTINFESEDEANKALEEDNTLFEGNRIRIKKPLPPSQTTLVVRSYAELTEPALSSVFTSAGRIRNVRRLVKGKKSMCTAFIEFDGPDAVERAIKMAEDVKIGGKKIFAAKFELRNKNKKLKTDDKNENDAGSDDLSD